MTPPIGKGLYRHYKGDNVEVTEVSREERSPDQWWVTYRHGKGTWVRRYEDFVCKVPVVRGETDVLVPRFQYLRAYGTQRQLFAQTLRENRIFWFKGLEQNPAMKVNGEGVYFKFTLGDKISFALSIRVITQDEAKKLIAWLNTWSTEADRLLDRREKEWESYCEFKKREPIPARIRLADHAQGNDDVAGAGGSSDRLPDQAG